MKVTQASRDGGVDAIAFDSDPIYGPDVYEFTDGKPLTLINGGNLLSLKEVQSQSR